MEIMEHKNGVSFPHIGRAPYGIAVKLSETCFALDPMRRMGTSPQCQTDKSLSLTAMLRMGVLNPPIAL
jgi:hypothetical protein